MAIAVESRFTMHPDGGMMVAATQVLDRYSIQSS